MEEIINEIVSSLTTTTSQAMLCTVMIVADTLSGYIKCFKLKNYNSSINRDGLARKMMWYLMLIVGIAIEYIAYTNVLTVIVTGSCCVSEFMSIIENARDIGIEFKLTEYLKDKE